MPEVRLTELFRAGLAALEHQHEMAELGGVAGQGQNHPSRAGQDDNGKMRRGGLGKVLTTKRET